MFPVQRVTEWQEHITYSPDGPQPSVVVATGNIKLIFAGLEAGQAIPEHPEAAAVYYFLEGEGWMLVDGKRLRVQAGTTLAMPDGTSRGMQAESRLAFMATRIACAPTPAPVSGDVAEETPA